MSRLAAGSAPPPGSVRLSGGSRAPSPWEVGLRGSLGLGPLRPPTGAGGGAGRRGGARAAGRGGARTNAPGSSAAAAPADLAAGERLGPLPRSHGSPRLPRGMRLHPDGPGPADPGAAGQLQPGSALRGQAEAGGEQRPRRPGGQEPADPGAGAADPGPEGPQLRGQRWVEPATPLHRPTLLRLPLSPSPRCFDSLLPEGAGPGILPTCGSRSLCTSRRAPRLRPACLGKAVFSKITSHSALSCVYQRILNARLYLCERIQS